MAFVRTATLTQIYRCDTSRMPSGRLLPEHGIQVSPRNRAILAAGFVRSRTVSTPRTHPLTLVHGKQHELTQPPHPRRGPTGPGDPGTLGPLRRIRGLERVRRRPRRGIPGPFARRQVAAARPVGRARPLRARGGRGGHRVRPHPAADPQRAGDGAGLDRLLLRRQDRDGAALRCRGQPRVGALEQGARPHAEGDARRGGPELLPEQRHLAHRHRAGRLRGHQGRPGHPGRVDDHPAVRQELLPHGRPHAVAQGPRDPARRQDRPAADQGPDPRELPQHHLLRSRRVRHPDRVEGLLQQGRLEAHPGRERLPGVRHPRALALRPGPG